MTSPLVSTIIPCYNYGRFVREAVESALAQTYSALEVIVVDDGSKDNTAEVMAAYVGNPCVRYIRQENRGLPGARNTGIRDAHGEFIALLDADDVWEPEKIEQQIAFYGQHPAAGLLGTASYDIDQEGRRLGTEPEHKEMRECDEYTIRDFLETSPFRPSSVMMRKSICEQAGMFDEEMKYVEDLDMWVRMSRLGSVWRLSAALTGFRVHPSIQSMHLGPHLEYHHRVLDKLFATVPELQSHPHWRRMAEARLLVHVSWMRYKNGDRRAALADLFSSILNWPIALRGVNRQKQRWKRAKLLARYAMR